MTVKGEPPRQHCDVVVVGASAGGVEALRRLVAHLPVDLPACLVVVLHVPSSGPSAMPQILSRAGSLRAVHATSGDDLEAGVIYVAPPDRHVLIDGHRLRLSAGARENGHRPAIDPLFRSAAAALGARVMGVVLSGVLDDGAAGLLRVKAAGGLAVVQDPSDALYPAMPLNAMAAVKVDHMLPVEAIAALIVAMAGTARVSAPRSQDPQYAADTEIDLIQRWPTSMHPDDGDPGDPTVYTCPDCSEVLHAIDEGQLRRYRCRTGHAWSPEALQSAQSTVVENALWAGLRSLDENASLATTMSAVAHLRGSMPAQQRLAERASAAHGNAEILRRMLANWGADAEVAAET
ncbi:MAG: chemotaxis protein CheB [Actinomycetota bacterium]